MSVVVEADGQRAPVVVGRESDLAGLWGVWQRTLAGERQVVLVSGEGGIGKTALVHAFLANVVRSGEEVAVMRGDCLDLRGGHEPFLPLLDAWTQACRGAQGDAAIDVLRHCAPGWLLQLHGVIDAEERARLQQDARGATPERLLRMLANAFTEIAMRRATILVVEDLHWADPETLDALMRIARDRDPAPLLVLATLRPDFGTAAQRPLFDFVTLLRRNRISTEIALGCLDVSSIAAFLASDAPTVEPAPELCAALLARTGGHPMFLSAAVRHLEQGGRLDEVPPDLRLLIEFEIAALEQPEQRIVEAGAVAGAEFASALVAAALESPVTDIEEALLDVARRHGVVAPSGTADWPDGTVTRRFRFRHPYYVEVALGRAVRARQRLWHGRIAERLRRAYAGEFPGTIALRVGWHLEHAGDAAAALEAYELAVWLAREECSHERIEAAASAALELLQQVPDDAERNGREIALRVALGPAIVATRGYVAPTLRANCERALEVARAAGAVGPQFFSLLTLSAIHQTAGDCTAARERAEELVALADRAFPGVPQTLARAHLGQIIAVDGQLELARFDLLAARDRFASIDAMNALGAAMWVDPVVTLHGFLGGVLLVMGYPDQARREIDAAVSRAERLGHSFSLATAHILAAGFAALARDAEATRTHGQCFIDIAVREGLMQVMGRGMFHYFARVAHAADEETVGRFAEAIDGHARRGILYMLPFLYCILAEAWARCGRISAGLDALSAAEARVAAGGEKVFLAEIHRLRGELMVAEAGLSPQALRDAEAELRSAMSISRVQGARWFELRATIAWARLLEEQGRAPEAQPQLAAIYAWFSEGRDMPDLQAAAALLRRFAADSKID